MDDGLHIRRIIVDSRTATVGAGSSDFSLQLPETVNLPRNYSCIVTDVCLTHSFRTVHGSSSVGAKNQYLYFLERMYYGGSPPDYTVLNRATLSPGNYQPAELATEIQTKMNAVSFFGPNAYTVSYSTNLQNMTITVGFPGDATYTQYHGFQIISSKILDSQQFRAYGETRLLYNGNGVAFTGSTPTAYNADLATDPQSADGLLSLDYDKTKSDAVSALMTQIANSQTSFEWPKSQVTGTVDVRNVHVLYLHSNALTNFSTIGPSGSRTTLARIPVTSLTGGVLFKQHSGNHHDYTDVSGKCLRVLDFSIRNSSNQVVDLHGGHVSFEIIFAPIPE